MRKLNLLHWPYQYKILCNPIEYETIDNWCSEFVGCKSTAWFSWKEHFVGLVDVTYAFSAPADALLFKLTWTKPSMHNVAIIS